MKKNILFKITLLNILPFSNINDVYCMETLNAEQRYNCNKDKIEIAQDALQYISTLTSEDCRTIENTVKFAVVHMFNQHKSLEESIYERNCRKLPSILERIADLYKSTTEQTNSEKHWNDCKDIFNDLYKHYKGNVKIITETMQKSIEHRPENTSEIQAIGNPLLTQNTEKKDKIKRMKDLTSDRLRNIEKNHSPL